MLEGFGVAVAFGVGVAVAFGAAVAVACGLGAAVGLMWILLSDYSPKSTSLSFPML